MTDDQKIGPLDSEKKLESVSAFPETAKETAPPPEQRPERPQETKQQPEPTANDQPPHPQPPVAPQPEPLPMPPPPKSEIRREIETILQADLAELYASLDEKQRTDFRLKGEETATQLERLIETAKITAKKVLQLLKDWLRLIPHLNSFFFEQIVKIKTDRIMTLNEKMRNDHLDS